MGKFIREEWRKILVGLIVATFSLIFGCFVVAPVGGLIPEGFRAGVRGLWYTLFIPEATRQDMKLFLEDFRDKEEQAFEQGDFMVLEGYFCSEEQYSTYELLVSRLESLGWCPADLDDVDYPAFPSLYPFGRAILTTETWKQGPCPPEESSAESRHYRKLVVAQTPTGWCILQYHQEYVEPGY